jgi:hypothetical protein
VIGEFHPGSSPLARALERSEQFIRRFVVLGNPQAAAVVLWLAHTHAFTAADATPYLSITSAEKDSSRFSRCSWLGPGSPGARRRRR